MQTLNQMLTETVFLEQTGKINTALTELLIAKGGRMKPTSREGTAAFAQRVALSDHLIFSL